MKKLLTSLIVLTMTSIIVPTASAHRPDWGDADGITEIENISTSYAFYEELQDREAVDIYTFEAEAGESLYVGINIPAIRGLEDFTVQVVLLGPSLPDFEPNQLPPTHPETNGMGWLVFSSTQGEDFFEPFTQTNYWGRQEINMTLAEAGTYYLLVWNPLGETGKYVLATGRAEVFSPIDLLVFPVWWLRVHAYFGHTPYLIGIPVAVILLIIVLRRRMKNRTQQVLRPA